jgi:hypothetical protein
MASIAVILCYRHYKICFSVLKKFSLFLNVVSDTQRRNGENLY